MKSFSHFHAFAALVTAMLAPHAQAALYASDAFDYSLGASGTGLNGGEGFGSAWSFAPTGTGASSTVVSGLSLTGISSSGNAMQVSANPSGGSVSGYLSREFGNSTPAHSNLWGSFLIKQTSVTAPNAYGGNGSVTGSTFQSPANRAYFVNPVSSYPWNGGNLNSELGITKNQIGAPSATLNLNEVFLVVYSFVNISTPAYSSNTITGTMWVLNQADVTAMGGNFTTANLDTNNRVKSTGAMVNPEFGTPTVTSTTPYGLFAQQGTAVFDEVRVGTTITDVLVVPEPSSSVLFLGGMGLCLFRRSRVRGN